MLSTRPLVGEDRVTGVQIAGTPGIYSRAGRSRVEFVIVSVSRRSVLWDDLYTYICSGSQ